MAYQFGSTPEIEVTSAPGTTIDPGKYYTMLAIVDYTVPENPSVLQRYFWRFHDLAPRFPKACEFTDMWREKINGELHFLNFVATPLFGNLVGRTYQVEMRSIAPDRFAPVTLDPRRTRELRQTGKALAGPTGLILLH